MEIAVIEKKRGCPRRRRRACAMPFSVLKSKQKDELWLVLKI